MGKGDQGTSATSKGIPGSGNWNSREKQDRQPVLHVERGMSFRKFHNSFPHPEQEIPSFLREKNPEKKLGKGGRKKEPKLREFP